MPIVINFNSFPGPKKMFQKLISTKIKMTDDRITKFHDHSNLSKGSIVNYSQTLQLGEYVNDDDLNSSFVVLNDNEDVFHICSLPKCDIVQVKIPYFRTQEGPNMQFFVTPPFFTMVSNLLKNRGQQQVYSYMNVAFKSGIFQYNGTLVNFTDKCTALAKLVGINDKDFMFVPVDCLFGNLLHLKNLNEKIERYRGMVSHNSCYCIQDKEFMFSFQLRHLSYVFDISHEYPRETLLYPASRSKRKYLSEVNIRKLTLKNLEYFSQNVFADRPIEEDQFFSEGILQSHNLCTIL